MHSRLILPLLLIALSPWAVRAEVSPPLHETEKSDKYVQHKNICFADTNDGLGLVMDIFVPTGKSNGLGVVDVVSGSWSSARGRLNDHKLAQMFDIMCGRGYTVFAIRPGSSTKFTGQEMNANLKRGIRWVKAHADHFGIDPEKLGICGASAGGHLASLAVVTAEDGNPGADNELEKQNTRIKAAIVFFPPTDFLSWGGMEMKPEQTPAVARIFGKMLLGSDIATKKPEEIYAELEKISPARHVSGKEPPFLFVHGDADMVVPLQQSKRMIEVLTSAGVPTELIIKKGGGHPWPTINEEIAVAADWLDRQLRPDQTAEK